MRRKYLLYAVLLVLLIFSCLAQENEEVEHKLVLFYSDTCPHCHAEIRFLESIKAKYPDFTIETYEISQPGSVEKMMDMAKKYNFKPTGVPLTFVNGEYFIGYHTDDTTGKEIEEAMQECLAKNQQICESSDKKIVELPFIGKVDTDEISLPIFTIIIGGLDGLNPCAMWVLTFLLTLLIYARSRKKMLLIGSIFVATSAIIYFLFMSAWLNFFLFIGYTDIMRIIIAFIALIFGLINIKELFFFKKGVSLTINDKYKPKIFEKMRKIVNEKELSIAIAGTIMFAIFVNFIELLCTAGLPAIYTNILTLNNLSGIEYYSYLVLYNLVYVIPLIIIVAVFVITMGKHKFTEKHGKILKLVSGILMLALGLIMLIRPELLSFG